MPIDNNPSGLLARRDFLTATAITAAGLAVPASASATPPSAALRRADRGASRTALGRLSSALAAKTTPPFALRVLTKMGFGPRPGDVAAFNQRAASDDARLRSYVDEQLNPNSIDDSELDSKLAASDFFTLNKSLSQLWADHASAQDDWEYRMRPLLETIRVAYLRARYSRRQLAEVLADFWHTHFSVHGFDFSVGPVFVHYDRDVIRANMLGNYRQLLEAVTQSTAMMYYLDNVSNRADGPNENYARELLELHALGARNAYGFTPEAQVPAYPNGVKMGYTEADIKAFTRCLTGWTVQNGWQWPRDPSDTDNGQFWFRAAWHDTAPKRVLGVDLSGTGMDQTRQVFDLLASHPKVAEFVCEKLCRRLISDNPPASVVQQAAAVFTAQHRAPDQLAQVVRTIVLSDAFKTSWGGKIKRPFETVTSALRALDADVSLRFDDTSDSLADSGFWYAAQNFIWQNGDTGHFPFDWAPPNGYPDHKEDWAGSSPLVMTWRVLNSVVNHWGTAGGRHRVDVLGTTWAGLPAASQHTPSRLVDFWLTRILGYLPPAARRQPLIDFMAQGGPFDAEPLDINFDDWANNPRYGQVSSRLRVMVSLILLMPEFLVR